MDSRERALTSSLKELSQYPAVRKYLEMDRNNQKLKSRHRLSFHNDPSMFTVLQDKHDCQHLGDRSHTQTAQSARIVNYSRFKFLPKTSNEQPGTHLIEQATEQNTRAGTQTKKVTWIKQSQKRMK